MKGVEIATITDDDLETAPKIKELIDKALQEKFPLNEAGKVLSDFDTLKRYHQYYATILAEKYSKDPGDFIRILPAYPSDLEISPKAYNYEFDGSYFEYNGEQYGWFHTSFTDYGTDDRADLGAYKTKHPLDPQRHVWAEITDEDLEKMPLLLEAINNIGALQEPIRVQNSMSDAEMDRYAKWHKENIPSGIFKYDKKYFRISFWIA